MYVNSFKGGFFIKLKLTGSFMALFLSTFQNKIDKKGRVSVPANFRSAIPQDGFQGVVLFPSPINNCLEGSSMAYLEKINESINQLDTYGEDKDALATVILGQSVQCQFDPEGRIIISKDFLKTFNLEEEAIFIGKGEKFEIWNPKDFEEYIQKAKQIALEKRNQLKPVK